MLIKLSDSLIVNTSEIETVTRCGNYTEIKIKGEQSSKSIWDQDMKLWTEIVNKALVDIK